ncbi:hypothetical protein BASA50_006385 [Batrachochytrium salamandrivorans]|uniref:Uncharacterized protein n=1 Tax=Batrachochytrium salamandrivorans TaxID=1357716 RepID=A0ABQ8FA04_9FUNG|nr:hypothetical protein BASA60_011430 [Batrachochytrium salamandrivorans]KAH6567873.1 hypothetical protein BASA62_005834 [Batrachochytrium salamandrivorans]KAH6589908.1 hypothetical protein BASA61_005450 [Batrachochytrium salamandrivorans]KAH6594709.1 hypothetical protein BASA50_006385 [Batrachochytrium salamandrivorans]KAH9257556.1 hypothetical protein BASA81_004319 [Batrachochytrium salamandrivorans]
MACLAASLHHCCRVVGQNRLFPILDSSHILLLSRPAFGSGPSTVGSVGPTTISHYCAGSRLYSSKGTPVSSAPDAAATTTGTLDATTNASKTARQSKVSVNPVKKQVKTEQEIWDQQAPNRNRTLDPYRRHSMRNYVMQNQPFPMNPYFKPDPPLSDATRCSIYKLFLENEVFWTPRRLAEQFGISLVRVQAILRLKALGDQLKKKGKPSQTNFSDSMERLLGSRTIEYKKDVPNPAPLEPIRYTFGGAMSQYIRLLDEEVSVTPEEAAKLLRMQPFSNSSSKIDANAPNIIHPPVEVKSPILNQNDRLKNDFRFMIVDTSRPDPVLLVRDTAGRLRNATNTEVWETKHVKPRKFKM